jgi:hypothetical protein
MSTAIIIRATSAINVATLPQKIVFLTVKVLKLQSGFREKTGNLTTSLFSAGALKG